MSPGIPPSAKPAAVSPGNGLFTDAANTPRCAWCQATPLYRHYHDTEWGFPVADDRRLFEKICLEGFQSGLRARSEISCAFGRLIRDAMLGVKRAVWLCHTSDSQQRSAPEAGEPNVQVIAERALSWLTILNKREAFRSAFANFEAERVAGCDESDVKRLLGNAGIVRHAGKIASALNNARRVIELRREFGSLAAYVWRLEPEAGSRPDRITHDALRAMPSSAASAALSRDLKKRGWTFVGPTTIYAFMQAMGLVNDHLEGCVSRQAALAARASFAPPV